MNECWSGPYCGDCPDREGCGQGVPCDTARSVAGLHLVHSPAAHDVIAAELVACTLGQRHRPELRTDLAGAMSRIGRQVQAWLDAYRRAGVTMAQAMARMNVRGEGIEPPTRGV